jgi:hypothetical protein
MKCNGVAMATTTYWTSKHIDRHRIRHDTRVKQKSTPKTVRDILIQYTPNLPMIVEAISGIVCEKLMALFSPRSSGFK